MVTLTVCHRSCETQSLGAGPGWDADPLAPRGRCAADGQAWHAAWLCPQGHHRAASGALLRT